jgi:rhodanese-related sulfurtransferase
MIASFVISCKLQAEVYLAPDAVVGCETVSVNQAKALYDKQATFIDVRTMKSWKLGHIPSAVHMDLVKTFSVETLNMHVPNLEQEIVIYCNGPRCLRSSIAAAKAVSWGYRNVYYFREGYPAWEDANHPVVAEGNLVEESEREEDNLLNFSTM